MRLTLHTFLTLDGVMQAPGGPDEDPDGRFEHGGWSFPYGDEDFGVAVSGWFDQAGRVPAGPQDLPDLRELLAAGHRPRGSRRHQAQHAAEVRGLDDPRGCRLAQLVAPRRGRGRGGGQAQGMARR